MHIRPRLRSGERLDSRAIQPRDPPGESTEHQSGLKTGVIVAGVFFGILALLAAGLLYMRWRRSRTARYSLSGRDDNDEHNGLQTANATTETASANTNPSRTSVTSVGRNTSIRSVMTLPPYRPKASDSEHVLGREGERGGIDVVVELPTAEMEEALREEEMDALFQIRQARRRQMATREERRRARREAQSRNDRETLRSIRREADVVSSNHTREIENLRGELVRTRETRQRTVSSVNYADLGVARHDGTRIRANSSESERVGLLSDAASIAVSQRSPSSHQNPFALELQQQGPHRRERSTSSALSIDTMQTMHTTQSLQLTNSTPGDRSSALSALSAHSRANSTDRRRSVESSAGQAEQAATHATAEADLGEAYMPPYSPPGYDEVSLNDLTPVHSRAVSPYHEPPPDYTAESTAFGPREERNRRLSAHVADLAAGVAVETASSRTSSSGTRPGTPSGTASGDGESVSRSISNDSQDNHTNSSRNSALSHLPSLRLSELPQIVIEPSSAVLRDNR